MAFFAWPSLDVLRSNTNRKNMHGTTSAQYERNCSTKTALFITIIVFFFFKLLLLYTIIYNFKDIVCCCFTLSLSDLNISLQTRPARVDGVGRSCVDGVPSGPRTCLSLPDAFAYLRSPMGESPLDANELWERPLSQPGGVRVGRVEAG